jgi:hypothetical protein
MKFRRDVLKEPDSNIAEAVARLDRIYKFFDAARYVCLMLLAALVIMYLN